MIVVKIGGGGGVNIGAACDDVARLRAARTDVVLIHGGSGPATALGEALGYAPRFIMAPSGIRSRYTDARTLEIFAMALGGLNAEIVSGLQARGVNAIGLSGVDGRVLEGKRKDAVITVEAGRRRVIRDDRSGTVESVNAGLLSALIGLDLVPVISPPALSSDGPINVDGDRAAALVATRMGAGTLVLLTNVPGLLSDVSNQESVVPVVRGDDQLEAALALAGGRMRIKLLAARAALRGGVEKVVIADGRRERPIEQALDGHGTVLQRAATDSPVAVEL